MPIKIIIAYNYAVRNVHKPCKPDFFRRFMKKHRKMNVISKMNPAPTKPATSKTYGFGGFVVLLLVVITLGSIGAGVDGSVRENIKFFDQF